nr:sucrose nonfermenting 4-like protein isoform X1 [Ipomoea batatas]
MVQTVFAWRYEGHEVYLMVRAMGNFSFLICSVVSLAAWGGGDRTVMNLVNGLTMGLSAAIDLPPGYNQTYRWLQR